jgi:hypothetical protein
VDAVKSTRVFGYTLVALVSLFLASVAAANTYGSSRVTQELQALIAEDPSLATALSASLKQANWNGIVTLEQFYDFVDQTVRMVPT